jgi:hypothetical protein
MAHSLIYKKKCSYQKISTIKEMVKRPPLPIPDELIPKNSTVNFGKK